MTDEDRQRAILKGKLLIVGMALLALYALVRFISS